MLRVILAGLHLLMLGLGISAVLYRGSMLREPFSEYSLTRVFKFDTMWGISAIIWIATGLWRLLGGIEKPTSYYLSNSLFMTKMTALILILLLEIWPMITLIRWRIQLKKGGAPTTVATIEAAKKIAILSHVQALLVVIMIFAAAGMARGFGS
jgi:putative membrane protein